MILTYVDAENRVVVYKYDGNGHGLNTLATLQAVTDDPLELAQIGATLALMAGETNGSTARPTPVKAKKKVKTLTQAEVDEIEARRRPKVLPAAKKKPAPKRMNPDYTPDLTTITGRIIVFLSDHEWSGIDAVAPVVGRPNGHVSATLTGLRDIEVVESKPGPVNEKSHRPTVLYRLTAHGHASLKRARA